MLPSLKGLKVPIPGTTQVGEAIQKLESFHRAFQKVENAKPGGSYKRCATIDGVGYVYDTPGDELWAMILEAGKPPLLRWYCVDRKKVVLLEE